MTCRLSPSEGEEDEHQPIEQFGLYRTAQVNEIRISGTEKFKTTASIGMAALFAETLSEGLFANMADSALYQARGECCRRVCPGKQLS